MEQSKVRIEKYSPDMKKVWNEFVESSKNGTFLFNRDYMDYHSDRFEDFSLLIYRKDKLYCLIPANRKEDTIYSHGGLTYGGMIMNNKCSAEGILEVFNEMIAYLNNHDIKRLIYKPVPHIYHSLPAEEDLYALFRNNAILKIRNISCTIDRRNRVELSRMRRRALKRAEESEIIVKETSAFEEFWEIMEENLKNKYNASPVHSLSEMKYLNLKFPDNIRLFGAFIDDRMIAGGVFYVSSHVVHAQYMHAKEDGKERGAIDALVHHLLKNEFLQMPYFDFGTSNEDGGRILNESLIHQKEGFGGRAICYDTYEIDIKS